MTDTNNQLPPSFKPPERGSQHYKNLRCEITGRTPHASPTPPAAAPEITPPTSDDPSSPQVSNEDLETSDYQNLFSININAALKKGEPMDESQMLLYMAFKPVVPGLKLTPEQSQLILAYLHEILKEAEIEEQNIITEHNAALAKSQDTEDQDNGSNDEGKSCT